MKTFLAGAAALAFGTACTASDGDGDGKTGGSTTGSGSVTDGGADGGTATTPTDGGDPAYTYDEEIPPPNLSAADVEAAMADTLPRLLEIDPGLLYDAYSEAIGYRDSDCPLVYEVAGVEGWDADCTSSAGWTYSGRAQALHLQPGEHDGSWYEEYGYFLSNFTIDSPSGDQLEVVGYGELTDATLDEWRTVDAWFLGVFRWDASQADGTWLGDDLSVQFQAISTAHPDGRRSLTLDGGASRLPGLVETLSTRSLHIMSTATGTACSKEPAGELWLKDAAGLRYTVSFDGPQDADDEIDAALCDECGTVTYEGEVLGEACMDFGFLLEWTGSPWD